MVPSYSPSRMERSQSPSTIVQVVSQVSSRVFVRLPLCEYLGLYTRLVCAKLYLHRSNAKWQDLNVDYIATAEVGLTIPRIHSTVSQAYQVPPSYSNQLLWLVRFACWAALKDGSFRL